MVSQALVDGAFIFPLVFMSLQADISCSVANFGMRYRSDCEDMSFGNKRVNHTILLADVVCTIKEGVKGFL